ncbi:transglutaminase-like domain-containing protein [Frigidibacter sp. ROC022]|uniref:transglutaminase-like domain-containing protein n=1 Tax=Frigidibacter sp. ROC022 TaxID=2971796 RepID=UPI00215B1449|nr:transglutaminase family protein [Frigidibacter sp. ROC022]MCR8724259.1 transglutaminase family protein [Frigidibacter sp. ROC022]
MILSIETYLDYQLAGLTSAILQVEAAAMPDQAILSSELVLSPHAHFSRVDSDGSLGQRVLLELSNRLETTYRARVEIKRPPVDLAGLPATPIHLLPGPVLRYLMGSRFCPSDRFQNYVAAEFGDSAGGARIQAMRDWIRTHLTYVPGESDSTTTALETFVQRRGVCRDFAHVMITLARASGIPARIASAYALLEPPQDFHAVAEVFLDGGWHMVDATGMARPEEMARIGVGRDAADVSFLTVYGQATLIRQSVEVRRDG